MTLAAHRRYLSYVVRHKWFVFVEACRLGIPVRGLLHDLSKFRPSEWFPYVESFYGPERTLAIRAAFNRAWLDHQHRNDHHWQHWGLAEDGGGTKWLPMPDGARKEMLADWIGAGKAQGHTAPNDCRDWYLKHREIIQMHPETRSWVEARLVPL
jgi:hypothetical protein